MPETDLALLEDAARASGEIAKSFFQSSPETWDKGGNDGPVTEADLAIDKMLRAELVGNRTDYGWLSEESEDDEARLACEHVFIVDPIDGTRAFIAGEKTFAHSLAIARNGAVVAAAVYLPVMDLMYLADLEHETTLNGDAINVGANAQIDGATVLASKQNLEPKYWDGDVPPIKRKFRPSLAYRLSLVAQGRFDAMMTIRPCWEWDIAAGDLIVRQAGGRTSDCLNGALTFNAAHPKTKGCLAANAQLHAALQSRLKSNVP